MHQDREEPRRIRVSIMAAHHHLEITLVLGFASGCSVRYRNDGGSA